MKSILLKIFLFLLVFSTLFYKSQKVTVRGIAIDTTKNRNFVMIVVNDTLRKHREMEKKTQNWDNDDYFNLTKNTDYIAKADKKGNYRIKAKPSDTLYFYSYKYFTQKYKVADIIRKKIKVQLVPEPCVPYVACEQNNLPTFTSLLVKKY